MCLIPHHLRCGTTDVLAFAIIVITARGPAHRPSGIPTLMHTILLDSTLYFLVIFVCQLLLLFFLTLAPVGGLLRS